MHIKSKVSVSLVALLLVLFHFSCAKLEEMRRTEITSERLLQADSIPAAWGKLVSVTSVPNMENLAQLWFQDDAGNIRMVSYNIANNYLLTKAMLIRRGQ